MYIKELNILSFGKFKNKKITFNNGLNIIYGENEAGKSTMHKFIEAMFYGLYIPNKKNRILGRAYYKYLPWNSDTYKGILKYTYGKNTFRIERNFLKEKEEINIYNEQTGKDISKKIKYNKNTRLLEPGTDFFGMNHTVFSNTISVGQLSSKTDEELTKEVKDKIINLSKSKDESISIKNVLSALDKKKDEIGTKNRKKSPLGQSVLRHNALKEEKNEILEIKKYVFERAKEIKDLKKELSVIEGNIKNTNQILKEQEAIYLKNKYLKAKELVEEINILNNQIENNNKYVQVSVEDYEEAIKVISVLEQLNHDNDDIKNSIDIIEEKIVKLKSSIKSEDLESDDISRLNSKYQLYKINIDKINTLDKKINLGMRNLDEFKESKINQFLENYKTVINNNSNIKKFEKMIDSSIEKVLNKRLKQERSRRLVNSLLGMLFCAGSLSSIYAAYYFNNNMYYLGTLIIVLSIKFFINSSRNKNLIKELNTEIKNSIDEQITLENDINNLKMENNSILKEYDCNDIEEYTNKYVEYVGRKKVFDEKNKLLEFDKEELKNAKRNNKIISNEIIDILKVFDCYELTLENIEKANRLYKEKNHILDVMEKEETLLNDFNKRTEKLTKEIKFENQRFQIILNKNNVKSIAEFKNTLEKNKYIQEKLNERKNKKLLLENILDGNSYSELEQKSKLFSEINESSSDIDKEKLLNYLSTESGKAKNLRDKISKIYGEVEKLENEYRNLADVEDEIEYYEEKICMYEEKIEAINVAYKKIVEISDHIHNNFVPMLNQSISDNFSHITNGKYKEIKINDKMDVTIIEPMNEHMIKIDSLSGGTIDQIYFALRFSLSNLMSNNSYVPFILDDSFAQYDRYRLGKSLDMIYKESSKRQILLFTCQKREIQVANQLGLKYNYVEL